ncbi:MAG: deaminase/reductase [Conexibacter sp.]|jgi:hypothetical protein|nr:deaminase/reductase [Conexibacter sp.]
MSRWWCDLARILTGVVEDPTGEEGFKHGGWFEQFGERDREAWAEVEFAEALGAAAVLLGRRSDEYFGTRWSSRGGEWADRPNSLATSPTSSSGRPSRRRTAPTFRKEPGARRVIGPGARRRVVLGQLPAFSIFLPLAPRTYHSAPKASMPSPAVLPGLLLSLMNV